MRASSESRGRAPSRKGTPAGDAHVIGNLPIGWIYRHIFIFKYPSMIFLFYPELFSSLHCHFYLRILLPSTHRLFSVS